MGSSSKESKSKSKAHTAVSPTPKDLKIKKSNVSCKIIFWGLVVSVALIMLACILDYQQSRLENQASRLPHEMQVATKYMIDLASEVPHKLEALIYSAKGGIIIITGKMHIGDKTVAQLLFGKQVEEEDPTPEDIKEDFKIEDEEKDSINESESNIDDLILEKVEEIATKLKKQEEKHIYEANRKEMKEKTLKTLEAEKKVAEASLLEEKEKLKARIDKNEAMTNVLKTNSKDRQNDGDKIGSSFSTSKIEEAQELEDAENVGLGKRDFKKKYEEDEAFWCIVQVLWNFPVI